METKDLKRKHRRTSPTHARVSKYRTIKKVHKQFSQDTDPDSINKSSNDLSVMSNSCDFINDNNSQSDDQNTLADMIKLEPDINLDFLSEEDGTPFTNQNDFYENDFKQQPILSNSKQAFSPEYFEIRQWAIDSKITEGVLQELIDILRKNLILNLPETAKEFLKGPEIREPEKQKTVKFTMNEFAILVAQLTSMQADIRDIANSQKSLEHLVRSNNFSIANNVEPSFSEKYEIELPIKDLEKLFKLESMLLNNPQCRKDLIASLSFLLKDRLSKSALGVIKKFLHRDVILKCTAVKQMEGKFVMRLDVPTFWHAIVDMLINHHKSTEKEVHSSLGTVLTNAKDWDGNRAQRDRMAGKSAS